jgi:tetratricopeptide (TPR) repeat protein
VKPRPSGPPVPAPEPAHPPATLLFNAILFLAGMGGLYFRMARDNDDLVRMALVLAAGTGLIAVLAARGARVPLSLALPSLAYVLTATWSSFDTVNPAESLKELMKIAVYVLLFLTVASEAARGRTGVVDDVPRDPAPGWTYATARSWGYLFALAGLFLAYLHVPVTAFMPTKTPAYLLGFAVLTGYGFFGRHAMLPAFRLAYAGLAAAAVAGLVIAAGRGFRIEHGFPIWSAPQVACSLGCAILWALAFALWLGRGAMRDSLVNGLWAMGIAAAAIGLLQFYGFDYLRPYDPPQPYRISLVGFMAEFFQPVMPPPPASEMTFEEGRPVLYLTRILGIHGNPNFFAPYIVQFIPLAVATAVCVPGHRVRSILASAALIVTMGLNDTYGTWFALILVLSMLGVLLGALRDPLDDAGRGRALRRLILLVAAAAALGLLAWRQPAFWISCLMTVLCAIVFLAAHDGIRSLGDRPGRTLGIAGAVTAVLLLAVGWYLFHSGLKRESLIERGVKNLMAMAMWKAEPLTGVGVNAYKSWYPVIQQSVRLPLRIPFERLGSSFTQENRTHNDLAQMLAETGVLGFGSFAWLMAVVLAGGVRRLLRDRGLDPPDRAALAGLLAAAAAILIYAVPNFPFHIVSSACTFWLIAGLVASYHVEAWRRGGGSADAGPPFGPAMRRALTAGGVAAALLMLWFCGRLFVGTLLYKRAEGFWRNTRAPDFRSAAAHYERALELDPFNAQYAYDYGALCFNNISSDPSLAERAAALLARAARLGFENEDLHYGLGNIAERKGDRETAEREYRTALSLNERHPPSRQSLLALLARGAPEALAAQARGDWRAARRLYRAAVERQPDNYFLRMQHGWLCVTPFGDVETGLAELERAAVLGRNDAMPWMLLGRARMLAGRFPEAVDALRTARALDRRNEEARVALEQAVALAARKAGGGGAND